MRDRVIFAAALLLLSACGEPEPSGPGDPLFDPHHAPDIQTEAAELAPTPSPGGNRLLEGWWPRATDRGFRLIPNPEGVSLEVVHLVERPREIGLHLEFEPEHAGEPIEVRIAGGEPRRIPLATESTIALPSDLSPGRVAIELVFPKDADVHLVRADLGVPSPAGRVDLPEAAASREIAADRTAADRTAAREAVRQSGTSLVEVTRYVAAGTRFRGSLEPPLGALAGQSFELKIETAEGGERSVAAWETGDRSGPLSFTQLLDTAGPVRFSLRAVGEGPPASWVGFRLHPPEPLGTRSAGEPTPPDPEPIRLVLVYVLDALRADALGAMGGDPTTSPFLDRLASEGVLFTDHHSVAPNTLPSTKAFFTGRTPMLQGNWKLAEGPPTLADDFRAAGFRTAAFSGNGFISATYGTARGFEIVDEAALFEDYTASPDRFNDNAAAVHRAALEWIDSLDAGERAFAYLHTIHPHQPYDPPRELAPPPDSRSAIDGSSRTLLDIKHVRLRPTEADRERIRALYAAGLHYNDRELERFLQAVLERYDPSQVLLVITADHGEELFDHGGVLHGYTLYEEQLHIPLILWSPGRLEPASSARPTTNVELSGRLREIAGGVAVSRVADRLAAPSRPSLSGEPPIRFAAASSVEGGIFMARSDRFKVIWAPRVGTKWGSGEGAGRSRSVEYVFDLERDPAERVNLAGTRDLEVAWLRGRLMAWIATETLREEAGELPAIDAETEARLRALGYLD